MSRATCQGEALNAVYRLHDEQDAIPEARRYVYVIVKDAHDIDGPGMTFKIGHLETLKDCFDTFKKACCRTCHAYPEIRFKIEEEVFTDTDTPKMANFGHNTHTEIRAYSNTPGLQCSKCSKTGYPKTNKYVLPGPEKLTRLPKNETITLRVRDSTGSEMDFKMVNAVAFTYLMETYGNKAKRDINCVRFTFDDEVLKTNENPKKASFQFVQFCLARANLNEHGLTNGDNIDVSIAQWSG